MAFKRAKRREPVGEAGLMEYAVRMLASQMRSERELRRLMQRRAMEGDEGERAMDAVVAKLKELNYLSDARFAAEYTRLRKEGKNRAAACAADLAAKGVASETVGAAVGAAYEGVDEVALARGVHCAQANEAARRREGTAGGGAGDGTATEGGVFGGCGLQGAARVGVPVEEVDVVGDEE